MGVYWAHRYLSSAPLVPVADYYLGVAHRSMKV